MTGGYSASFIDLAWLQDFWLAVLKCRVRGHLHRSPLFLGHGQSAVFPRYERSGKAILSVQTGRTIHDTNQKFAHAEF
jgi:hypothetical protein